MTYNFISGLPRSGSTLLASILDQNPGFHADIISPLGPVVSAIRSAFSPGNETHTVWTNEQRHAVIEAAFDAFYEKYLDKVIFDTHRRWCADASLIAKVFPDSKIICCVREPTHVVDSFERLFRKNPLVASVMIQSDVQATVYERVNILLQSTGVVGYALNALRDAFYGPERKRLLLIEYNLLARHPGPVLERLHEFLDLAPFEYDFNNIKQVPGTAEFDRLLGAPGLHDLQPKVTLEPRTAVLPPDLIMRMPKAFWRLDTALTKA
jgi:sulfotransferase